MDAREPRHGQSNPRRTSFFLCLVLAAVVASQLLFITAAAAITPVAAPQFVVWTVNTGNNTGAPYSFGHFDDRVRRVANCPDIVLLQETISTTQANNAETQLDNISSNCGDYGKYHWQSPTNPTDIHSRTSVAWRKGRFELLAGDDYRLRYHEKYRASTDFGDVCSRATNDNGKQKWVVAVKLRDRSTGNYVIAASAHLGPYNSAFQCTEFNMEGLESAIANKSGWGLSLPLTIGGDHNRKVTADSGYSDRDQRLEIDPRDWYTNWTRENANCSECSGAYADTIKEYIGGRTDSTLDSDSYPDICGQWSHKQDGHGMAANDCNHADHGRIDYLFTRNIGTISQADTDQYTDANLNLSGNQWYSDHKGVHAHLVY